MEKTVDRYIARITSLHYDKNVMQTPRCTIHLIANFILPRLKESHIIRYYYTLLLRVLPPSLQSIRVSRFDKL